MTPHPLLQKPAPGFTIKDQAGVDYVVKPGKGQPLVLFFYPASGSYGCTKEACDFRDAITSRNSFKRSGVEVVGISADSVEKQRKFVDDHKLGYPVLSDADGTARKAYHVPRGLFGLSEGRVTFCIDQTGTVQEVVDTVINFGAHVKAVDKWLASLPVAKADGAKPSEAGEAGSAPVQASTEEAKPTPEVVEPPAAPVA